MKKFDYMEDMFYLHDADCIVDVPEKVYIEPTSTCNLNCKICFRHGWIDEKLGYMSMECFDRLADSVRQISTLKEAFFGGMGEPLCHPDIYQMISELSEGLHVSVLTNGTMLTEECSKQLVDAGLDMLWVSMDGFEQGIYESIQLGSRFNLIVKNLRAFNKARTGTSVKLGITFVVSPDNVEQLQKINAFADEFNVDEINISHMIPGEAIEKEKMVNFYDRADIPVGKMHRFEPKANETQENVCPFIQQKAVFVKWNGDVVPCMQLLHSCYTYLYDEKRKITSFSYGNILKNTLKESWENEEYQEFRQRVNTFYFPFCRVCFGCDDRKENKTDCFLGESPTCGACLWATGKVFCP